MEFASVFIGIGIALGALVNLLADVLPSLPMSPAGRKTDAIRGAEQSRPAVNRIRDRHWLTPPGRPSRLRWTLVLMAGVVISVSAYTSAHRPGEPFRWLIYGRNAFYLSVFLLVLVVDLKHRRILNVVTVPVTVLALIVASITSTSALLSALAGGLFGFTVFMVMALLRPGAMGLGDVKFAGMIGVIVGFPLVDIALVLGILAGGVGAAILLIARKTRLGGTMAYGPYLAIGAGVVLLRGAEILSWYVQRLGILF